VIVQRSGVVTLASLLLCQHSSHPNSAAAGTSSSSNPCWVPEHASCGDQQVRLKFLRLSASHSSCRSNFVSESGVISTLDHNLVQDPKGHRPPIHDNDLPSACLSRQESRTSCNHSKQSEPVLQKPCSSEAAATVAVGNCNSEV
jgi:hypothetical protein